MVKRGWHGSRLIAKSGQQFMDSVLMILELHPRRVGASRRIGVTVIQKTAPREGTQAASVFRRSKDRRSIESERRRRLVPTCCEGRKIAADVGNTGKMQRPDERYAKGA